MTNRNQIRREATRTADFAESLNSFESAVHDMSAAANEAMSNLASVYYHARGNDRENTLFLIEEFGKVSDALVVINGVLGDLLGPHKEAK